MAGTVGMSQRARAEWRARTVAEYHSAAITAQLVQWMIQVGLDPEVVRTGLRVVSDELAHAELSWAVVQALGDDGSPDAPSLAAMTLQTPAGMGAALIDGVLRTLCYGETLAVPLFARMRKGATLPAARTALDRIVADEAVHSRFGWDALDGLLALDRDGTLAYGNGLLAGIEDGVRASYVELPDHAALTDVEREAGLIAGEEYAAIVTRSLAETVRPRLARRGFAVS